MVGEVNNPFLNKTNGFVPNGLFVAMRLVFIALIVCVISFTAIFVVKQNMDESRKETAIKDCLGSATYTVVDATVNSTTTEPIDRYFESCMKFNGYNGSFVFNN